MRKIVLTLVLSLFAACAAKKPPPPPTPTVTVAAPLSMDVVDWDDFLGQFVAVDSVDVRPRVSGYLQRVGFKDGERVHKGQVLFVIDPRPYQAVLDQAEGRRRTPRRRWSTPRPRRRAARRCWRRTPSASRPTTPWSPRPGQAAADVAAARATVRTGGAERRLHPGDRADERAGFPIAGWRRATW